jgi:hypothetical protein
MSELKAVARLYFITQYHCLFATASSVCYGLCCLSVKVGNALTLILLLLISPLTFSIIKMCQVDCWIGRTPSTRLSAAVIDGCQNKILVQFRLWTFPTWWGACCTPEATRTKNRGSIRDDFAKL